MDSFFHCFGTYSTFFLLLQASFFQDIWINTMLHLFFGFFVFTSFLSVGNHGNKQLGFLHVLHEGGFNYFCIGYVPSNRVSFSGYPVNFCWCAPRQGNEFEKIAPARGKNISTTMVHPFTFIGLVPPPRDITSKKLYICQERYLPWSVKFYKPDIITLNNFPIEIACC